MAAGNVVADILVTQLEKAASFLGHWVSIFAFMIVTVQLCQSYTKFHG